MSDNCRRYQVSKIHAAPGDIRKLRQNGCKKCGICQDGNANTLDAFLTVDLVLVLQSSHEFEQGIDVGAPCHVRFAGKCFSWTKCTSPPWNFLIIMSDIA